MTSHSGLATFLLLLLLMVVACLQTLSMVQSARMDKRLDHLIRKLETSKPASLAVAEPATIKH